MRKFFHPVPILPAMHPIPLLLRAKAFRLALCLAILASLVPAALRPAHAAPPATYSKDGVSFDHPAGWKVTEDVVAQDTTRMRSIDLEGPNEAVVTLMFSPFFRARTLRSLRLPQPAIAPTPQRPTPHNKPAWGQ